MTRKINRKSAAKSESADKKNAASKGKEVVKTSMPKIVNIAGSMLVFVVSILIFALLYMFLSQLSVSSTLAMSDAGLLEGNVDTVAVMSAMLGGVSAGLVVVFPKFYKLARTWLVFKPFELFQNFVYNREIKKRSAKSKDGQ